MAGITNLHNPVVKYVRSLERRKEREREGAAALEGIRLVEEALGSGAALSLFLHSPRLMASGRGMRLLEDLRSRGVREVEVTDQIMDQVADTRTPQGILAVVRMKNWTPEEALRGPAPIVVMAEGMQDPGNVGTIIRSAEALGASGVFLAGESVDPYNPKVLRSTMGSIFRLPVVSGIGVTRAVAAARESGLRLIVADPDGHKLPWDLDLSGSVMLAIGNEGAGVSPGLIASADETVRIPMPGRAESLNAAVAASLLLYEAAKQRLLQDRCDR